MYKRLHEWHVAYGDQLEMLLYPSDEFGGQELPSEQIPGFVTNKGLPTKGGGCTLMAKVSVNGPAADPVWRLAKAAFGGGDIQWNFAGIFLFDKQGKPVGKYTAQELDKVEADIEALVHDREL